MQRTLIISGIAFIILAVIGVGAYLYFATGPSVSVAPTGSVGLPTASNGSVPVTTGTSGTTANPSVPATAPAAIAGRLVEISTGPVVIGEAVTDTKTMTASSTPDVVVNYIDRESGNVYSYLQNAQTLTRVNNKTLPGIQSASWLNDASAAFVQYLSGTNFSTINTYSLAATSSNGFFLPQNLSGISASVTGLLTLASGVNGSVASIEHLDGTHSSTLFTTPLTDLRVSFAGKNQYLAFSKPAASLTGDVYLVDSAGNFSRIAGPLNGLVALASPTGKWVLVSYTLNGAMQMELVNTTTNTTIALPIATIADKCVWTADESAIYCGVPVNPSTSATYPDDWYQGTVQFSDRIWKINVAGRYAQLTLDFSQANKGDLDAEALAVDPSDTTLVFVNKNDGSLWSYAL